MQQHSTSSEIARVETRTARRTTPLRTTLKNAGVIGAAAALVGVFTLPAVAVQPVAPQTDDTIALLLEQNQQTVSIEQSSEVEAIVAQGLSATTPAELEQIRAEAAAAEAARQAEIAAAQAAAARATPAAQAAPAGAGATPAAAAAPIAAPAPGSGIGGQIVSIAQSQLGVPYVWGGASPSTGFDCSGFTQWVFGQVGIYLPHSDAGQKGYGATASASSPQPGDLILWSGHVAIYVGDDTIIHAATSGKPVKYSSYSAMVGAFGTPQVRRF